MGKFATGAQAAEERASTSGFPGRAKYLSGEKADKKNPLFFRVYTEKSEWVTVDVHQGIPTRSAPDDFKGTWPPKMGAVCANDVAFRKRDASGALIDPPQWDEPASHYGNCWIHANMADQMSQFGRSLAKASSTVYGLVVLREPVRDGGGEIKGFKDKMEEFEDRDGKKHQVPAIRVAAQKWSNFWGAVNASSFISGTTRTQDFMFTKSGNELEVTPLGPTPGHAPGTDSWKPYDEAIALMNLDLGAMLLEQASPEYYARFFDPSKERPVRQGEGDAVQPDEGAPAASVSEDEIAALRNRMAAARTGTAPAQS